MTTTQGAQTQPRSLLLVIIGLTFLALMLASIPNLLDPMVRHDDFPALLADPREFYVKTLYEGRWLNYWWHLRTFETPSWVNFVVYQLFWAIFSGAAAVNASARGKNHWPIVTLALMIGAAPSAYLISLWFNTLIPGLGFVALFAVLAVFLSPGKMRLLLPVFVPITLMAYTSYPLLLLAVCLTTHGVARSWRNLIGTVLTFIFSFALGIVLIYSLNYAEHGVFGIPMAEWRNPTPVHDLASLLANLQKFFEFLTVGVGMLSFNYLPFIVLHAILLSVGLYFVARADPWAALYIVTGMLAGLGLLGLQVVLTGVTVPPRALSFFWLLYSVICVRMALLTFDQNNSAARLARSAPAIIIAAYLMQTARQYSDFRGWQALTKEMAAQVEDGTGPIYVTGSYLALPEAEKATVQKPRGLRLRLTYLTGRTVFSCEETPQECETLATEPFSASPDQRFMVRILPDKTIITLRASPQS